MERRGRALLGRPLGADAERSAVVHHRSAQRRDSVGQHRRVSERPDASGRPGTSSRPAPLDKRAQQLPLPDELQRRAHALPGGASDRPRARLPAQPQGQLDLHRRAGPRSEVGQGERLRRVDHGRRAVQLRRAAGRRHRPGRSDSEDRPVRQVRRDVGLQADSDGARRRIRKKTTLDQWAREQDTKPYLRFSTEGAAATDPGEQRRSRRRRGRRGGDDARA